MPVYQGANSCVARREGWYVRRVEGKGVDTVAEAVALAWAVLRDYRRGYTYDADSNCKKIRMTWEQARRRLKFIVRLARWHGATRRELETIKRVIAYALRHKRLPKTVEGHSTKAIVKRMVVKKR